MAQFADQFAEARTTTSSFLTQKRFGFERNQQNNRQNNDRQFQSKDNQQATSTNQMDVLYVEDLDTKLLNVTHVDQLETKQT